MKQATRKALSFGQILALAVAMTIGGCVTCTGGMIVTMRIQVRAVGAFCGDVRDGEPVADVRARAAAQGFPSADFPGPPPALVMKKGIAKSFCWVEHDGIHVTSHRAEFFG